MQIKEITPKVTPLIESDDFFQDTDKLWNTIADTLEVWFVVQDYTRHHGNITNCIISRAIEKLGKDRVVVVVSSGMHRASSQSEMDAMLGPGITQRLRVYSHNPLRPFPFPRNIYTIGIHSTTPHNFVEISHAGKMLIPGLISYNRASVWHKRGSCDAREQMEDAALNQIDTVIDYCIDHTYNMISSYVGRPNHHYDRYLTNAKECYKVKIPDELPDVAILYPVYKNKDFLLAMNAMTVCHNRKIVRDGGTVCISSPVPDHMGTHFLFQQPNGLTPAFYDEIFHIPYNKVNIVFQFPKLPEMAIQEYFKKRIFNLRTTDRLDMFIGSIYGNNATVHKYHGSDMMIGE